MKLIFILQPLKSFQEPGDLSHQRNGGHVGPGLRSADLP